MKTILIILLILLIIFIILVCSCSIYLAHMVAKPKKHSVEEFIEKVKNTDYYKEYLPKNRKDYSINSFDGYEIHICLLQAEEKSKNYVIFSHGYTANRISSLKHIRMYRDLGYNVIIYDDRGHGDNDQNQVCTLGKIESKDLICLINETYEKYGKDIYLGLHGESMGSGLEIMALQYKPDVKFIVNDCGYGKLVNVLKFKIKHDYHLPAFLVNVASVFSKIFYKFSYNEVRPILYLKENKIPICFITGSQDMFVPATESMSMYAETSGYKELHLFEGVGHAVAKESDPERYNKIVKEFLEKIS